MQWERPGQTFSASFKNATKGGGGGLVRWQTSSLNKLKKKPEQLKTNILAVANFESEQIEEKARTTQNKYLGCKLPTTSDEANTNARLFSLFLGQAGGTLHKIMHILRRGLSFFLLLNKDGEKKKLVAFSPFLRCCVSAVGASRANVLSQL